MNNEYFNIVYSNKEKLNGIYDLGTSSFLQEINEDKFKFDNENYKILKFKLYKNSLSKNFTKVWNDNLNNTNKIEYNRYFNSSLQKIIFYKEKLNETINYINNDLNQVVEGNIIDESLKVSILEKDIHNLENDKLNKIHEYFEDKLSYYFIENYDKTKRDNTEQSVQDLHKCLERINFLVHLLEHRRTDKWFYNVIRLDSSNKNYYNLLDKDYKKFTCPNLPGVLYVDFGMVGKDLFTCYTTNDIDLAKKNKVHQQCHIKPFVNYEFNQKKVKDMKSFFTTQKKGYYKWCNFNEIDKVIPYKQPMYNIGRIALGETENVSVFDFENIVDNYPNIVQVYISNE